MANTNADGQSLSPTVQLFDGLHVDPVKIVTGIAAAPFDVEILSQGLDWLLSFLCRSLGADDGEILLAELHGAELLTSACVGVDQETLLQKTRFRPGQGYPGIAYVEDRPLASNRISADCSMLRRKGFTAQGIRTFVSVPIPGPSGMPLGCLDLAWKRDVRQLDNLSKMMTLAASPLGRFIGAAFLGLREKIARENGASGPVAVQERLSVVLQSMLQKSGADSGRIVGWDLRTGRVSGNVSTSTAPPVCPSILAADQSVAMPSCLIGSGQTGKLASLKHVGDGCPKVKFNGSAACCLPVVSDGVFKGIALLGFHRPPNFHPVQSLVALQIVANEAAGNLQRISAEASEETSEIPKLEINCFGPFEIRLNGQPILRKAFPRRRALSLLKILALHAGRPIHRERLIDWLWPDEEAESVRLNRLYGLIHTLRNVIEPNAKKQKYVYILSDGENYVFDSKINVTVDLIRFREMLRLAEKIRRGGADTLQLIHCLSAAVELYKGDLFECDPYAEWCQTERAEAQKDAVNALVTLAHLRSKAEGPAAAIADLQRAIRIDPLREDLHHALVDILISLGRSREAIEQCNKCFHVLREELGVEPTREFMQVYQKLILTTKKVGSVLTKRSQGCSDGAFLRS